MLLFVFKKNDNSDVLGNITLRAITAIATSNPRDDLYITNPLEKKYKQERENFLRKASN